MPVIQNEHGRPGTAPRQRGHRKPAPSAHAVSDPTQRLGVDKISAKRRDLLLAARRSRVRARVRGFTLLELLVVIVIIGLLAAYVGPRYFAQLGKSERGTAKAQIEGFGRALDVYRLDTGHYPPTSQGLNALVVRPANEPKWNGPYLQKEVPLDPWGKPYLYRTPGRNGNDFDLLSYGRDGQPGGEGDDADVAFR